MTLDDCGIPYTVVSSVLLQTKVKAHIVNAIQAYREKSTRVLTGWQSRHLPKHTREQAKETLSWMLDHDLVETIETVDTKTYRLVEPQGKERISIPSTLDYNKLSVAQIRLFLTFLSTIKGTHFHEFKCVFTRKQFAAMVGVHENSLYTAIKELVAMRLFEVEDKIENPGTKNTWRMKITMLDPRPEWRGWKLKDVADAYRAEREYRTKIPVHDRYEYLLASYQPANDPFPREPVDDYNLWCPFCPRGKKPTMDISSKTKDSWVCANKKCRKGGNSLLLWARLKPYVAAGGPEKLQRYLKRMPTMVDDPEPVEPEPMDQSIDAIFEGEALCQ